MNDQQAPAETARSTQYTPTVADDQARRHAVNPAGSFIVRAPAGSGKTTLLVDRFLNLLGQVDQPEELIAITFTRKATAEMRHRILKKIRDNAEEAAAAIDRNRRFDWKLLTNPQRLKIQTIDSLIATLTNRMPVESQMSLEYSQVEYSQKVFREAVESTYQYLDEDGEASDAVASVLRAFDSNIDSITDVMVRMLATREDWVPTVLDIARYGGSTIDDMGLWKALESSRKQYVDHHKDWFRGLFEIHEWDRLQQLCDEMVENRRQHSGEEQAHFLNFEHNEDFSLFASTALTKRGNPPTLRKSLTTAQGFPRGASELKTEFLDFAARFEDEETRKKLQRLRDLPDPRWTGAQRSQFRQIANFLILLLDKLKSIFEANEFVDFTERSIAARRALSLQSGPTDLTLALDHRISHILVDEFQDTSIAQHQLLQLLTSGWQPNDGRTFFAVGDPQQSIYLFRNAHVQNFTNCFEHERLGDRELIPIHLKSNFRSAPVLVNWVNETFDKVFAAEEDDISGEVSFNSSIPATNQSGEIELHVFDHESLDNEQQVVVQRIRELNKRYPRESVALLVPTRLHVGKFIEAIDSARLSWQGSEINKLNELPLVRDLCQLYHAINDPYRKESWFSFLLSPLAGVDLKDLETINQQETEAGWIGGEALLKAFHKFGLSDEATRTFDRFAAAVLDAMNDTHRDMRARLERLWYRLGGHVAYQSHDDVQNAEQLFEVVENTQNHYLQPEDLELRLEDLYATQIVPNPAVEIMTIHAAKGLEFDHVLLVDLGRRPRASQGDLIEFVNSQEHGLLLAYDDDSKTDPFYDQLKEINKEKEHAEKKRLLYVAVTRARKTLSMFGTQLGETPESYLKLLLDANSQYVIPHPAGDKERHDDEAREYAWPSKVWKRLPRNWKFDPACELPGLRFRGTQPNSTVEKSSEDGARGGLLSEVGANSFMELGNTVHEELHRMVVMQDFQVPDENRIALWRDTLRIKGLQGQEIASILEAAPDQIRKILEDDDGQWLLTGNHTDSHAELQLDAIARDGVKLSKIDRTFIDEAGDRWIIDYKTSMTTDDSDDHIQVLIERYSPQLKRYAEVFRMKEKRTIRTALYLTALPRLIEIDLSNSTHVKHTQASVQDRG